MVDRTLEGILAMPILILSFMHLHRSFFGFFVPLIDSGSHCDISELTSLVGPFAQHSLMDIFFIFFINHELPDNRISLSTCFILVGHSLQQQSYATP